MNNFFFVAICFMVVFAGSTSALQAALPSSLTAGGRGFRQTNVLFSSGNDELEKAKKLAEQAAALRAEADAMEAEKKASTPAAAPAPAPAPAAMEEELPRVEISSTMKEKLRRELEAQGANPNKAAANPILIISGVIAVLVILAGGGIFY
mmetsp:Transcript_13449/g.21028  ORF Transcript_13449/g.21028 Transcript_13449/m.21028 type:complete len:150 (+) Transcript_13449:72-521(+)